MCDLLSYIIDIVVCRGNFVNVLVIVDCQL